MKKNADKDERVIIFDVDKTLIMWDKDPYDKNNGDFMFTCPYTQKTVYVKEHKTHINLVKHFSLRGYYVIVMSGSGGKWAKAAVEALGLKPYVNKTMCKPLKYVDDMACEEWMGQRIYLKDGE